MCAGSRAAGALPVFEGEILIAGEKDEIIPAHLTEKNAKAYKDTNSVTAFEAFEGRSHYICGEPGWEEVAQYASDWLERQGTLGTVTVSRGVSGTGGFGDG